jgi:hypothetical protein
LPEEQVNSTHLNERKIKGLLKRYRDANNGESGEYVL